MRNGFAAVFLFAEVVAVGCSSTVNSSDYPAARVVKPVDSDIGSGNTTPTALIDGYPIDEDEFRNLTMETSGQLILNEMAIDRVLAKRLDEAGLVVGDADVERERQALLVSLDDDPEQAVRLLRELRKRRALGPRRFEYLLRRNAGLRMLVRDDVDISEDRLRDEFVRWYGPRYRIRLMTLDSQNKADAVLKKLRGGDSFNETAAKVSTDISASRGGLLAPFSLKDQSYPLALREVIGDLLPGEISPVIPIDNQFAIVQVVERIPGQRVTFDMVRDDLLRTVRRNEERRLMDVLARELVEKANVMILDPVVKRSESY